MSSLKGGDSECVITDKNTRVSSSPHFHVYERQQVSCLPLLSWIPTVRGNDTEEQQINVFKTANMTYTWV